MTSVEFHARLKALAKKRDKKLKDIENYAGIAEGTISNWKGFFPAADTLGRVAEGMNTSVDYLLGYTECDLPSSTSQAPTTAIILNTLEGKNISAESAIAIASTIETIYKLQESLCENNLQ